MKIEFLPQRESNRPFVRLFDYRAGEVKLLRQACADLADGCRTEFALHEQPWIQSIHGCRFFWRIAKKDIGVTLPAPGEPLVLEYSDEAWREVEGKLQPFDETHDPAFANLRNAFNWLTMEGEVNVLISLDGRW